MDCRQYYPLFERLIEQASKAEFRFPEDSALIAVAIDLTPKVSRLLRESLTLLRRVERAVASLAADEDPSAFGEPDSLSAIGQLIASEVALQELGDLVYFAIGELRGSLGELEKAVTTNRVLMMATLCESGLRSTRRALVSVEAALFRFEDLEPPEHQWVDVDVSLEIRKLYRDLRQDIMAHGTAGDAVNEELVRAVLYRLLAFRELRIYPFLRVDDRVHLRNLLKRMLEWLNSEERDQERAGELWRDLTEFAQILAQVSFRQELREHDRQLVDHACRVLFQDGAAPAVPEKLRDEVRGLLGLNDALDRLIEGPEDQNKEAWRLPLANLLEELGSAAHAGSAPWSE